jgi:hypothetical protein
MQPLDVVTQGVFFLEWKLNGRDDRRYDYRRFDDHHQKDYSLNIKVNRGGGRASSDGQRRGRG